MERKQKTKQEKYERWARLSACVSMALGIGIIPLGVGFFHGIHVIEKKPHVFWGFFAALIAWCTLGSIVVILLRKKVKQLEKAASLNAPHEISNPLFESLIPAYKLDRLERLTKNNFFRSWKLSSDDLRESEKGSVFLTLVFTNNQHEILLDFSEEEASVAVDEESGSDKEPTALSMENYKTLDELLSAVTDVCQKELGKD